MLQFHNHWGCFSIWRIFSFMLRTEKLFSLGSRLFGETKSQTVWLIPVCSRISIWRIRWREEIIFAWTIITWIFFGQVQIGWTLLDQRWKFCKVEVCMANFGDTETRSVVYHQMSWNKNLNSSAYVLLKLPVGDELEESCSWLLPEVLSESRDDIGDSGWWFTEFTADLTAVGLGGVLCASGAVGGVWMTPPCGELLFWSLKISVYNNGNFLPVIISGYSCLYLLSIDMCFSTTSVIVCRSWETWKSVIECWNIRGHI